MFRSLTNRRMPKPFAIIVAALLALYFVPLNALPASAATIGGFEIDGNQVHDSAEDWKDLPAPTDGVKTSLPDAGGKTNRVLTTFLDNTIGGQDDTVSGSNNKENPPGGSQWPNWSWTDNGNATGKSDYGRVAAYSYVQQVSGQDHVFLVLGFDRGSNVGGTATANYYFELNQKPRTDGNTSNPNPNRQTGDIRITINDQGAGVFSAPVIEKWTAVDATHGSWGPTSGQNPSYDVTSNSAGAISDLASWWTSVNAPNHTIDKEGFIEASLDLTSFGAVLGCPSTGFSTLNGRSSTGASDKNLVDYFKATPISVPSSCASLFIQKFKGDGTTPLGGATFKITPNPLPVGADNRPSDDFLTIFDDSDNNAVKEGSTNYDDPDATAGLISVPGVKPGVEYTITEVSAPDGWIKDPTEVKVTPVAFGTSQSATNTASFTNHRGSVTFSKDYEGDDPATGASFTLTRDNDDANALYDNGTVNVTDNGTNDSDPAMGTITVDPLDAGSWKLIEDVGGAPTGWIRDNTEVFFTVPDAQGNRDVTLQNPTLTDVRRTYPLTVRKVAKSDNAIVVKDAVFDLYKETTGNSTLQLGAGGDTKVGSCQTLANGECTVSGLAWGEKYYWYEVSVPAPYNLPSDRVVGPITINADGSTSPSGTSVFEDPKTKIVTQATNGNLPGATISDTATLSGVNSSAEGAVTFDLYYTGLATEPTANSCVPGNLVQAGIAATKTVAQVGNGDYTTGPISVTKAGYYAWVAHYSGDSNGNRAFDSACDDTNETSYVPPLTPGITTVAQAPDDQLPGAELYDTAKVSPVSASLDTQVANVDFRLYGPDDATCSGTAVFTSLNRSVTVVSDGNGGFYATAESAHFAPTLAGTYRWTAHFDGDGSNVDADSPCNAANESSTVKPANPSIVTNATADDDTLPASSVKDSATVSGLTANATGSVTFKLYSDASCSTLVTTLGPIDIGTVTNGSVTVSSGSYTGLVDAGTYYFIASYKGDANNKDVAGKCGDDNESVIIKPGQPSIETNATTDDDTLPGASVKDTATVSGLTGNATGTVTFTLYSDNKCSTTVTTLGPIDLGTVTNGTATVHSGDFTGIVDAGTYYFIARYSGDDNNKAVSGACGDDNESVTIKPGSPKIVTNASADDDTLPATSVKDSATVSGLTDNATGTVTFTLYSDATCATLVTTLGPIDLGTVTGGTATVPSGSYTGLDTTGTYYFIASYSGDNNNNAVAGNCGDDNESVTIKKAGPAISTQVPAATERLAPTATLTDTATLSGATTSPAATGTITFRLYGPFTSAPGANSCTAGNLVDSRTATVNGNGVYSPATGITVHVTGFYTWVASYSGDANNQSATHACGMESETVEVLKAASVITTDAVDHVALSNGSTTISDKATLSAVTVQPAATGTIEFKVYGPFGSQPAADSCTVAKLVGGGPYTVAVNGAGQYTSPDVTVDKAGYYVWVASYSGDDNNLAATHACGQLEETSTVDSISTKVADASVALPNASLVDTATLEGGTTDPKATGTITFKLYGPFTSVPNDESCVAGKLLATKVVDVTDGNGSYVSPAVVVGAVGYYTWVATYSGDANNAAATHACGMESETVHVTEAPTDVTTVATGQAIIQLGETISDAASVTGLAAGATGSVTFSLYGPDNANCSGTPVFTSTIALVVTDGGNGTATGSATSAAYKPTAAGTYRWVANYSGDDNNLASAGECNDPNEQSVVKAGNKPELDKFSNPISGSAVQPNQVIHYSVKVSNTGDVAITNAPVLDDLPPFVSAVAGTISDGGVLSADGAHINWVVTLAPGGSHTFTYDGKVAADAPSDRVLVNTAKFFTLQDTTSHVVPSGKLAIVKVVSPVAGNGVVVEFGDKLTYTLTVSATGGLDQPNVVVSDVLPGRDPAHPKSGDTTFVAGTAKCIGAGTCTVTGPDANGLITWNVGKMDAGTTRQVTFQVTIDDVKGGDPGETVAVDIINQAAVRSDRTPTTPSNVVVTPVSKVLPVKIPRELPHTGATLAVGPTVGGGLLLLGLGVLLLVGGRRRSTRLG